MVLKKIKLHAYSMNEQEMKGTLGGVSAHEYCCSMACTGTYSGDQSGYGYQYGASICSSLGMSSIECCFAKNDQGQSTCDYIPCP